MPRQPLRAHRVRNYTFRPEPVPAVSTIKKVAWAIGLLAVLAVLLLGERAHSASPGPEPRMISRGPLVLRAPTAQSCIVVGDSIALSVAEHLPECYANARIGAPAWEVVSQILPVDVVIVSAGSNNERTSNANLDATLEKIRVRAIEYGAKRVVWILPIDTRLRMVVGLVALSHGDPMVAFRPGGLKGQAHVHPGCNSCLAAAIREKL